VDELVAFVGLALVSADAVPELTELAEILRRVQHELFNLGSIVAARPGHFGPKQPTVTEGDTARLEQEIDEMNATLGALRSFVLAGGSRINAELHVCRTVCRRAERLLVKLSREEEVPAECLRYLNRLSDAFFVWSRWANHVLQAEEVLWEPNLAAGAQEL
jgi:cob(I)alamin adenosyltransferase